MSGHLRSLASFASRIVSSEDTQLSRADKNRLHVALEEGNLEEVRDVLGSGSTTDINKVKFGFIGGQSALHKTAHRGFEELVELLIDKGADPNVVNDTGKTPLHSASNKGYTDIARLLVKRGHANVNVVDNWGYTPLRMGIRHKEMLLFFMEETDADPNIADTYQRTPLHEAVAMPDQDSVHLLVARGKANPNQQDLQGKTPLHDAVLTGSTDIVNLLANRLNSDPNIQDNEGSTPLHYAVKVESSNLEIVRALFLAKADTEIRDNINSSTPLLEAVRAGKQEMAQTLLEEVGADAHVCDKQSGNNILHLAANLPTLLQYLLEKSNVDHEKKNESHQTPFDVITNDDSRKLLDPANLCRIYRGRKLEDAAIMRELRQEVNELRQENQMLRRQMKEAGKN